MPLPLIHNAPTLIIRRPAFESAQLTREMFDTWLNLTPDEVDAIVEFMKALDGKGYMDQKPTAFPQ